MLTVCSAGSVIRTEKYYLLVYETAAVVALDPDAPDAVLGDDAAAYWSSKLKCNMWYIDPGTLMMVLKDVANLMPGTLIQVLAGDRAGWIIYYDWEEMESVLI